MPLWREVVAFLLLTGVAQSLPGDQVPSTGTVSSRDSSHAQIVRPYEGLVMHCNVTGKNALFDQAVSTNPNITASDVWPAGPCVAGRTAGQTPGQKSRQRCASFLLIFEPVTLNCGSPENSC